jgi:hypothetical protein
MCRALSPRLSTNEAPARARRRVTDNQAEAEAEAQAQAQAFAATTWGPVCGCDAVRKTGALKEAGSQTRTGGVLRAHA